MKKFTLGLLLITSMSINLQAQNLQSAEYIGTTSHFGLTFLSGIDLDYDVDLYKLNYTTVDANGNPTIASGAFAVPVTTDCSDFPLTVYQHGTVLNKENVPSRDNAEAVLPKILAAGGYYTCTPDYIGMGDSPGLHPYMHAESEATAAIDMMRAARQFLNDSLNVQDNGQVFITGYSQGGHAAMALHKYIEDNDMLEEFDVVASAPASGPYAMSASQMDLILSNEPYTNPGYLVYVLSSYQLVYNNIYTTYSDVLQSPYDTIVVPYFNGDNISLSMDDLNPLLPQQVQDLVQPAYYSDLVNNDSNTLRLDLMANDNYNWVPIRPITMYYCTEDEQVSFDNTLTALDYMTENGAQNVSAINAGPFTHGGCVIPALTGIFNLFQSLRTSCTVTGIESYEIISGMYPNPVRSNLTVVTNEIADRYELISSLGQVIQKGNNPSNSTQFDLDLSSLESGIYYLRIFREKTIFTSRAIVKM